MRNWKGCPWKVESWRIPQRERPRSVDRPSSGPGGDPFSGSFSGCARGSRPTTVSPGFLDNFIAAPINAASAKVKTAEMIKVARELPPRAELPRKAAGTGYPNWRPGRLGKAGSL